MPNHVRNKITFDCSPERRAEILAAIEYDEAEQRENERGIDFNKIIPMPQSLDITSGSTTDHAIELYLTSVNPAVKYYGEEKMEQESFNFD